jgi:hypothetical protein
MAPTAIRGDHSPEVPDPETGRPPSKSSPSPLRQNREERNIAPDPLDSHGKPAPPDSFTVDRDNGIG